MAMPQRPMLFCRFPSRAWDCAGIGRFQDLDGRGFHFGEGNGGGPERLGPAPHCLGTDRDISVILEVLLRQGGEPGEGLKSYRYPVEKIGFPRPRDVKGDALAPVGTTGEGPRRDVLDVLDVGSLDRLKDRSAAVGGIDEFVKIGAVHEGQQRLEFPEGLSLLRRSHLQGERLLGRERTEELFTAFNALKKSNYRQGVSIPRPSG